jgi:catechol 2,3-dioxygenase-like lactoylglutathione lyase family enzyme
MRGHELDHVVAWMRDPDAARETFSRGLGFSLLEGGPHEVRTESFGPRFQNGTFLDLMGSREPPDAEIWKTFEHRRGAAHVAINVPLDETVRHLQARRLDVLGPRDGHPFPEDHAFGDAVTWRLAFFRRRQAPASDLFLIEYDFDTIRRLGDDCPTLYRGDAPEHPNTAQRLAAAWIVVRDLEPAVDTLRRLGLAEGGPVVLRELGTQGVEFEVGGGSLLLLQPMGAAANVIPGGGRTSKAMGVSIEVDDLGAACDILEGELERAFEPYAGLYGESLLVPAELTQGLWIELFSQMETAA